MSAPLEDIPVSNDFSLSDDGSDDVNISTTGATHKTFIKKFKKYLHSQIKTPQHPKMIYVVDGDANLIKQTLNENGIDLSSAEQYEKVILYTLEFLRRLHQHLRLTHINALRESIKRKSIGVTSCFDALMNYDADNTSRTYYDQKESEKMKNLFLTMIPQINSIGGSLKSALSAPLEFTWQYLNGLLNLHDFKKQVDKLFPSDRKPTLLPFRQIHHPRTKSIPVIKITPFNDELLVMQFRSSQQMPRLIARNHHIRKNLPTVSFLVSAPPKYDVLVDSLLYDLRMDSSTDREIYPKKIPSKNNHDFWSTVSHVIAFIAQDSSAPPKAIIKKTSHGILKPVVHICLVNKHFRVPSSYQPTADKCLKPGDAIFAVPFHPDMVFQNRQSAERDRYYFMDEEHLFALKNNVQRFIRRA